MSQPPRGRSDYLALGDYNAVCWRCAKKFKASELRRAWQGYYVCRTCWEPRHPQDFVRAPGAEQPPPWTQVDPAPIFIGICSPNGRTSIVDYAEVDCAIVDYVDPAFDPTVNN